MIETTYSGALREALREEMKRDPSVIVLGEEVGVWGGVYRVTYGFLGEFGPERVLDTPISEAAIVGAAIGAALGGLRPVAEIMYMDFLQIAMEQLVTQASKVRYLSGGKLKVPLVVRTQYSLGRVHGPQHSQYFPAWFLQAPGLKVVLPSTPYDAKGLLKAAIRDDNPVLFIEAGVLYGLKGFIPEEEYLIPLGQADVKRQGKDVTIVAVSRTVHDALAAAEDLAREGVEAEVIDPQTIQPLDMETILNSVKKTHRLIITSDDMKAGGLGSEIAARVVEEAFYHLDAPVVRVASPNLPAPFSPTLEQQYIPNKERILQAAKTLLSS